MTELTAHQIEALDRYDALQRDHPELFSGRYLRPIVTGRADRESFAKATGAVVGLAAKTDYFLFVNDLVEGRTHHPFVYSRVISVGQLKGGTNVAVFATIADAALGEPGSIVLVEQERHAIGKMEIAIPRGFAEPNQDGPTAALRELREETGYSGPSPEFLGESVIDSGAGDARVSFYWVQVTDKARPDPERGEAIHSVRLLHPSELRRMIGNGAIRDGFTLQALTLAHLRDISD